MNIKRGDIFIANLSPVIGSEQAGTRPVLVVQNNTGNKYSPTVIVIPITSKEKHKLPTHIPIEISKCKCGLEKDSILIVEQLRTIDKSRLKVKIGSLDSQTLSEVKEAIKISLNIRGTLKDIFDWE